MHIVTKSLGIFRCPFSVEKFLSLQRPPFPLSFVIVVKYVSACSDVESCPTLCDSMDGSLSGSSVHGISQARILELGCHFLLQGNLPDSEIEPTSASPAIDWQILYHWATWEAHSKIYITLKPKSLAIFKYTVQCVKYINIVVLLIPRTLFITSR